MDICLHFNEHPRRSQASDCTWGSPRRISRAHAAGETNTATRAPPSGTWAGLALAAALSRRPRSRFPEPNRLYSRVSLRRRACCCCGWAAARGRGRRGACFQCYSLAPDFHARSPSSVSRRSSSPLAPRRRSFAQVLPPAHSRERGECRRFHGPPELNSSNGPAGICGASATGDACAYARLANAPPCAECAALCPYLEERAKTRLM